MKKYLWLLYIAVLDYYTMLSTYENSICMWMNICTYSDINLLKVHIYRFNIKIKNHFREKHYIRSSILMTAADYSYITKQKHRCNQKYEIQLKYKFDYTKLICDSHDTIYTISICFTLHELRLLISKWLMIKETPPPVANTQYT